MRKLVVKSGISEEMFNELRDRYGENPDLAEALNHLLYHEWRDVNHIWTLPYMSEETWEMYDLLDITGLTEQVMLNDRLKLLKKAVQKIHKENT